MTWGQIIILVLIFVWVIIPPSWDPAIRYKERLERKRLEEEKEYSND